MKEQRNAELGSPGIKRVQPVGIDPRVGADAAGQIGAHQTKTADCIVEDVYRDLRIEERNCRTCPDAARVLALRTGHFLIPEQGIIAPHFGFHIREMNRKWADRAHNIYLVAQSVHMGKLIVEIEPFLPAVQRIDAVGVAFVGIATPVIHGDAGIAGALTEMLQKRSGPPVKMGIDDMHGAYSPLPLRNRARDGAPARYRL
jgi:hypothetical protein